MQKMTISTSSWGAQHPNAGRNIQQHGQATFLFSMIWYFCEKRVSAEDRHGCHSKNKPFFYFFFCQIYCYCDTFVRPVFLICQINLSVLLNNVNFVFLQNALAYKVFNISVMIFFQTLEDEFANQLEEQERYHGPYLKSALSAEAAAAEGRNSSTPTSSSSRRASSSTNTNYSIPPR